MILYLSALSHARLSARRPPTATRAADITPPVSVIIAAYNEVGAIAAPDHENLLGLDYPPERLEIVIASDGSDDGTDAVVMRYEALR